MIWFSKTLYDKVDTIKVDTIKVYFYSLITSNKMSNAALPPNSFGA